MRLDGDILGHQAVFPHPADLQQGQAVDQGPAGLFVDLPGRAALL